MKKRFFAALLCLCLVMGLLPVMALAADGDTVYVGGVALSGSTASPVYATTDANGTVTSGGSESSYNIKWDGSTLTLKDATIKKALPYSGSPPGSLIAGAAIGVYNQSGNAELTIQLEGQNTLSDTSTGIYVYSPDNGGEASLTITGSGSLTANSTSNSAIQVQSNSSNATLTIQNADVTATAAYGDSICVQSGENSNAALTVNGGSLTASGSPGIEYNLGSGVSGGGTPSLTVSGNAVVRAEGGISENSTGDLKPTAGTSGGIVFNGSDGTVYGNVTLQEDLTIGAGESLTLDDGATLNTGSHNLIVDGGTLDGTVTGNVTIKVTKVTLDQTSLTLDVGGTATLTTTVEPDNATNQTVAWSSDPSGIVTITPATDSKTATITAEGTGSTTITATADGKSATCSVTVNEATHSHNYGTGWSKDASGHWQECSDASCPETDKGKTATTAHGFDDDSDTTCDTCGYTRTITPSHAHSYGSWAKINETQHQGTCSCTATTTENHSGGTATCQSPATCSVCGASYGSINPSNHTGGTEIRDQSSRYTGDTYCLGCGVKLQKGTTIGGGGGGGYTPPKPQNQPKTGSSGGWNEIQDELADLVDAIDSGKAKPGETITVEMNGATEVPGKVLAEIAGNDVNVEFDMGGGVTWTVNGQDIPTGIGDLNLGIKTGGNSIPVNVINTITGETAAMQLSLSHNGPFGTTLHLSLALGEENRGYWANLYYYDGKELRFQHASRVDDKGRASWPFDHASSYAVIIDDESHTPWENPFTDIKETDWFYEAVAYVNKNGLMGSTSATEFTFEPDTTTSRAMIVTILHRMEGTPATTTANPFTDVADGQWYADAVIWAAENGITSGTGDGTTFSPDDPITREQFAAFLYRYAQHTGIDVSVGEDTNILSYEDALTVSEYAIPAMQWACGAGIIGGMNSASGGMLLDPQGKATRAQAAVMLQRFCENVNK